MDLDWTINVDSKKHSPFEETDKELQVEEPDGSCGYDFIEIVPLTTDTDGFCTTKCSGDWSDEVKQENLTVVKQEPDDVSCIIFAVVSLSHRKQFIDP